MWWAAPGTESEREYLHNAPPMTLNVAGKTTWTCQVSMIGAMENATTASQLVTMCRYVSARMVGMIQRSTCLFALPVSRFGVPPFVLSVGFAIGT